MSRFCFGIEYENVLYHAFVAILAQVQCAFVEFHCLLHCYVYIFSIVKYFSQKNCVFTELQTNLPISVITL